MDRNPTSKTEAKPGGPRPGGYHRDSDMPNKTINYRVPSKYAQDTKPGTSKRKPYPDGGYHDGRRGAAQLSSYDGGRYNGGYDDSDYYNLRGAASLKTSKRPKSRFTALFAVVILAGAVICVSAFALMINALKQDQPIDTPTPSERVTGTFPIIENRREVRQVCLIKGVDADARTFTLYSIDDGRMFYMSVSNTTEMKDSYGKSLVFAEYKLGDVVDVVYYDEETTLISIRQSAQGQTYFNQDGIIVDTENNKITRLNTTYIYGQELVCLYKGQEYDISKISAVDKVTLRIYRTVVVFVEVTASHGAVDIAYNEYIRDGSLEITPAGVYSKLDENKHYDLPEGNYKVIVNGSNIETFMREVTVKGGETVSVNLSDVQYKVGFLYFSSNVKDIYLTVNGTQVDPASSLTLKYGAYEIKVTAMGYEPLEKIFEFNKPEYTFQINMQPLPTPTPKPVLPDTVKFTIYTYVNDVSVPGAEVYIDGKYAGQTPLTVNVELGPRSILITKSGYKDIVMDPFIVTDEFSEKEYYWNLQESGSGLP